MSRLVDRLSQRPFEVIFSGGMFGFYAHAGVVMAVEEMGLRPRAVGGTSAGSIIAGLWGAGFAASVLRDRLFALRREQFWDPAPLLGLGAGRGLGLLRGEKFAQTLQSALAELGVSRFEHCRIPVRIVVWDVAARRTRVLTTGALVPAIRASCCLPGLFQGVTIDGRQFLDGALGDRSGLSAAATDAPILYHHLGAQVPWARLLRLAVPARAGVHVVHVSHLPVPGPFSLSRGRIGFAQAREATLRALEAQVPDVPPGDFSAAS